MKNYLNNIILCCLSVFCGACFLGLPNTANGTPLASIHADYDAVLKRFVADGRVDYAGLKGDGASLDRYLDHIAVIAQAEFGAWTTEEQLALLINLYNAATLKLILDHYPVQTIKEIGRFFKGPWDQPVVRLFGETITLDNLEHDIIRKQFLDARIHMALVCAAKGCPPLRSEAYGAGELDAQLDDQSRVYLSGPAGLKIDRDRQVVYFSSIFKWYGKDFVGGYSPTSGFIRPRQNRAGRGEFCRPLPAGGGQGIPQGWRLSGQIPGLRLVAQQIVSNAYNRLYWIRKFKYRAFRL